MNRRKPPLAEADVELFRSAVGPVKPLAQAQRPANLRREPPPPTPRQTRYDEQQVLRETLSDEYDPALVETGDELSFAHPSLPHRQFLKLRRGQFTVHAELDLHGMTSQMARIALTEFMHECRRKQARCVRIIHGKGLGSRHGRPVLKHKINVWLRQIDAVLAFCSARPVDGGTGAVYVLLRG